MNEIAAGATSAERSRWDDLWRPLLIIAAAYALLGGWNLHTQAIANPDEPRYAVPARLMLERGDLKSWLVPEFNTRPRLLKPIFFYWLIASTGYVGEKLGLDLVTGFRLGPLLMGFAAVAGIFLIGRKLFNTRVGFIAAIVLMTGKFFHEVSRELVVDMTLTGWLVLAWVCVIYALERLGQTRPQLGGAEAGEGRGGISGQTATSPLAWLLSFYVCLGLACMTKGPALVAIFVVAPLLAYLLWMKQLPLLKHAGLPWGVPLALVLGCAWFVAVQKMGYDMFKVLKTENVARAVGGKDHQQYLPLWFYFKNLFETYAPWCVLFPFALWWTFKGGRATAGAANLSPAEKLLACALAVPFVLLGLIISKRALYMVPAYPFIALWLALFIERTLITGSSAKSWRIGLSLLAAAIVAGCGVVFVQRQAWPGTPADLFLLLMLAGGIVLGLLMAVRQLGQGATERGVMQVLAVACAVTLGFEAVYRPIHERDLDSFLFYRTVCERLNGRPVVMLGDSSNEAVWYLHRPDELIDDIRYPDLKERFFEKPGTVLLLKQSELDSTPKLKEAVLASPPIRRGGDNWIMAVPRPGVEPDPEVFVPKRKRAAQKQDEE